MNDYFWQLRFLKDFGEPDLRLDVLASWREKYISKMPGDIYAVGYNAQGELGLGHRINRFTPAKVPFRIKAVQISAGWQHTVVLDSNGKVWVTGSNQYGQLGLSGTTFLSLTPVPGIKAKMISAGASHTLILDLSGNVWTFGSNFNGQLGIKDALTLSAPTQIPGLKAKYISTGNAYSAIIDLDCSAVWGFGQLSPSGGKLSSSTPTLLDPNLKVKALSVGTNHIVALSLDQTVWVVGDNSSGQLGLGDREPKTSFTQIPGLRAVKVYAGWLNTFIIDLDHLVWVFGYNRNGQLGLGDNQERLTPIRLPSHEAIDIAGFNHLMFISPDRSVWVCGNNDFGQLGLGVPTDPQWGAAVPIPGIKSKWVTVGYFNSFIIV